MGRIKDVALGLWKLSPQKIYHYFKNAEWRCSKKNELKRIEQIPRYTEAYTNILGEKIKIVDSSSFLFMYHEIFETQIYKFLSSNSKPYIIDCGANIGLSVIYFKKLFPDSRIMAFEPDPKIFAVLKENIEAFNFRDINLVQKGLTNSEGEFLFFMQGADGGRITNKSDGNKNTTHIKTTRLKNFLTEPVDLLKIDIEGKETEVLLDCVDVLDNVKNIFVEYHSFINQKQKLGTLLDLLIKSGFRVHINTPGLHSKQPFVSIPNENNMDLQVNIYAYKNN